MHDKELVLEILKQIFDSTQKILKRFRPIKSVNDFTDTEAGMEKLDAICMQLIAIGEALKNLDKITAGALLSKYPQIEWKKVKGMRDVISHHYFDIDAEAIYKVCTDHVEALEQVTEKIMKEVRANGI